MNLVFAGTPDFAAETLRAVFEAGHRIVSVLTQPDRRSGRGMAVNPSPVKRFASLSGIPVLQPETLKDQDLQETIRRFGADVMIVCAYGLVLPQAVLNIPLFGCINIHASLLPRWRGAAPIQRAILAGDTETGVSIMQMDAGLDTGAILMSESLPIAVDETAASLHDKLATLGGKLAVRTLERLPLPSCPQLDKGVVYASKIEKNEARIDWTRPAKMLECQIRAFDPFPGANFVHRGGVVKVWKARVEFTETLQRTPGTVLRADGNGIVVACGEDALRLLEMQKAGGRRMQAAQFLAGNPCPAGLCLIE
ncbi:MAG: methionyl-tRNA formyltransferase [Candidatus Accumulibacter sp.]|jgi:methionyl-tRNA formyltransferase|nr:methionyl-tRNA formyltransferase [Accumulibacter sp.]